LGDILADDWEIVPEPWSKETIAALGEFRMRVNIHARAGDPTAQLLLDNLDYFIKRGKK
jgi:hypothetical protein